jgi:hypothetical protein
MLRRHAQGLWRNPRLSCAGGAAQDLAVMESRTDIKRLSGDRRDDRGAPRQSGDCPAGLDSGRRQARADRLAVAELRRFPDLASTVSRTARELSAQVAAQHLSEITQSDELGRLRLSPRSTLQRQHGSSRPGRGADPAARAVRTEARDATRRDRPARGARRCVLSCRLPARRRYLSLMATILNADSVREIAAQGSLSKKR